MPAETAVVAFVRGDEDWRTLLGDGVEVELRDSGCEARIAADVPVVQVTAADLSRGLLVQSVHGGDRLREWSLVLLAAGHVEFDVGESADEDQVVSAIWEASMGNTITEADEAAARRLMAS